MCEGIHGLTGRVRGYVSRGMHAVCGGCLCYVRGLYLCAHACGVSLCVYVCAHVLCICVSSMHILWCMCPSVHACVYIDACRLWT